MATQQHSRLFDLPAEIRLMIYDNVFALSSARYNPVQIYKPRDAKAFLATCS
jgi:hypothetical protein